jgi:hypothetical protein
MTIVSAITATGRPASRRQYYELQRAQAKNEIGSFTSHWQELNDFILPRRGRFTTSDTNKGDRRSRNIIDSSGTFAANTLQAGMHSGLTSPARPWFQFGVADPTQSDLPEVQEWLHDISDIVLSSFARTNVYHKLPLLYRDAGVFATGVMIHLEDKERTAHFDVYPVGSYMLTTDAKGKVNGFIREYRLQVHQLLTEFGQKKADGTFNWSNFSMQVKMLAENGQLQEWVDVVHIITENYQYDAKRGPMVESKLKKYVQCYYEPGMNLTWPTLAMDIFLDESGFDEFPVYGFRWEVTGEDAYGTNCPGMTALGDIKQLQHGEKRGGQALDLLVKPPMKGTTAMRNAKASIIPGDITYVDETNEKGGFKPVFEIRPDLDKLEAKQEQKRFLIRRAFHEDLFLSMISDNRLQRATAREVEERHEEKLLALGPTVERAFEDVLDPMVTRQFNICQRAGLIPEPPEVLRGRALKIEYISIMASAQKMVGLGQQDRFVSSVIQLATVSPDALDGLDIDEAVRTYRTMTGVSPKLLRNPKEIAKIREGRAKAEQAKAQAATLKDVGSAAASLSKADTRKPSALNDLLSQPSIPVGS